MDEGGDIVALFAFHINHVISKSRRSSKNEVVQAIRLIILRAIWNVEKTLQRAKNPLLLKEIGKVKTNKSIAKRINRCVMTEIGKTVRIFGKNPLQRKRQSDCSGFNLFSMHDINLWRRYRQNSWCNKRNNFQ